MTSYLIMILTCHYNYYFVDQGLLVLELLSQLKYSLHHKYQRIVRACVGRPRPVCPHGQKWVRRCTETVSGNIDRIYIQFVARQDDSLTVTAV